MAGGVVPVVVAGGVVEPVAVEPVVVAGGVVLVLVESVPVVVVDGVVEGVVDVEVDEVAVLVAVPESPLPQPTIAAANAPAMNRTINFFICNLLFDTCSSSGPGQHSCM